MSCSDLTRALPVPTALFWIVSATFCDSVAISLYKVFAFETYSFNFASLLSYSSGELNLVSPPKRSSCKSFNSANCPEYWEAPPTVSIYVFVFFINVSKDLFNLLQAPSVSPSTWLLFLRVIISWSNCSVARSAVLDTLE